MKKVGIITYHRAYNYGSVLQAYALNKYIRSLGYLAETIDFRTLKQEMIYRNFEPLRLGPGILRNIQSLLRLKSLREQKKNSIGLLRRRYP